MALEKTDARAARTELRSDREADDSGADHGDVYVNVC
jgi:hypothetical protein